MNAPSRKILLVDDEPDVRDLLKAFLEGLGYLVFTAASAQRALELVGLEKPDLVFQDVVMPQIDGIECLKSIKALSPDTIVIMVSGLQDESIAKEAISNGAYDYITKPFDLNYIERGILSRLFYF